MKELLGTDMVLVREAVNDKKSRDSSNSSLQGLEKAR